MIWSFPISHGGTRLPSSFFRLGFSKKSQPFGVPSSFFRLGFSMNSQPFGVPSSFFRLGFSMKSQPFKGYPSFFRKAPEMSMEFPASNQSTPRHPGLLRWHALIDGDLQALSGDAVVDHRESHNIEGTAVLSSKPSFFLLLGCKL